MPAIKSYNRKRATEPPFAITYLTAEQIDGIRSDCLADDVEYILGDLCMRSQEEVAQYFDDGGEQLAAVEPDIKKWCREHVKNAQHRKVLEEGLLSAFPQGLRQVHVFLATHSDSAAGLSALLKHSCGEGLSPHEAPYLKSALEPLYASSHRTAPAGDGQQLPAGKDDDVEYDTHHFAKWVQAMLSPLGWSAAMPWELSHSLQIPRKPHAIVRLFTMGGIAETSYSFNKLLTSAPAWCEVRPIELPGHGFRDAADEDGQEEEVMGAGMPRADEIAASLKASGGGVADGEATRTLLLEYRRKLVRQLVDEMAPLLDGAPYALFGFSMGALLTYLIVREVERRGLPLPISLMVMGRGAPHDAVFVSSEVANYHAMSDDEFISSREGIDIRGTTANFEQRKARVSQRWRLGSSFAMLHEGDLAGGVEGGVGRPPAPWPHRMAAKPPTPLPCSLVTLWSDGDEMWGREATLAWAQLVPPPCEATAVAVGVDAAAAVANLDITDGAATAAGADRTWHRHYDIENGGGHFEVVMSSLLPPVLFRGLAEATADLVVGSS